MSKPEGLEDWAKAAMDVARTDPFFGVNRHTTRGIFDRHGTPVRTPFWRRFVNACGAAWAVFRGAMRS